MNQKNLIILHLSILVTLGFFIFGVLIMESSNQKMTMQSYVALKMFLLGTFAFIYTSFLCFWLPEYEKAENHERRDS